MKEIEKMINGEDPYSSNYGIVSLCLHIQESDYNIGAENNPKTFSQVMSSIE